MRGCSIRATWILNAQNVVVFSRRFPMAERRWREACNRENESCVEEDNLKEGSAHGFGIRTAQSTEGSDSWVDDPIMRHILNEEGENHLLWLLTLHIKGQYCIIVLPLVEPRHLKAYARICKRSDCGNAIVVDESVPSLLFELPSITGAFLVAHAIGDIIPGDMVEPEIVVSASPAGGLLDSLTGGIGIAGMSARPKPVAASAAASAAGAFVMGAIASDAPKIGSRPLDKDALSTFISSSMPFGWYPLSWYCSSQAHLWTLATPLYLLRRPMAFLNQTCLLRTSSNQHGSLTFSRENRGCCSQFMRVFAAMYDRDEIPDSISISGQVNCRADLEGLPDISFPLTALNAAHVEVLSFHSCAYAPEQAVDKQAASVMFSPPLGNFVLLRYQAICGLGPPIKGFYQLSMVSEDEEAFLFKLSLMEGYKAPLTMDFCTITMPFPRRVVSFDGMPSIGTVSTIERSIEWKIITSGRGITGKSVEATFPGTIRFAPWQTQRLPSSRQGFGNIADEESDNGAKSNSNMVNVDEFLMEKMNKDLPPVDLEEPFCWQAYNYAKVSLKIVGASLSGTSIDTKSVSIYPPVKAPVELLNS
ncbi:Mu homology domain, partial [Dillenia turbinata]